MAQAKQGSQTSTFISYSRKDKEFVQKLNDALDNAGVQAWVDWEGIELAADWMQTISHAIQTHNAFIFIISPDSLNSTVCGDELELGLKFNKKLIPILYREPEKGQKMHEKLAATNWVYMRKQDNFDATLPKLIESIQTDLEWISKHTQLLGQATEWEGRNRNSSYLLQGTGLAEAEKWMADATDKENRSVLPLQAEYIHSSRKAADRRQRMVLVGVSLALVVSIALSIIAFFAALRANKAEAQAKENQHAAEVAKAEAEVNQKKAEDAQKVAEQRQKEAIEQSIRAKVSRGIAEAQTLQYRAGELATRERLAIEAYQLEIQNNIPDTFSAEDLLRSNTSRMAVPVAHMKQDGAIWNIEWSPDGKFFVTGNGHDPSKEGAVNKACVYQAEDGGPKYCVIHGNDVNDAVFTRDGKYLVTASADQTVRFWDAATGKPFDNKTLVFGGAALDLDVSDEVLAIGREDNFLTLYYLNKPDLKPVDVEQADGVGTLQFSPSGELLAFGLQNGQVRFWQARNNFFYNGPRHDPSSYAVLAWSPDNLWLVSGGGDSLAKLTKRDGSFKYDVPHQDWVEDVAFGPDPSWFVTASDDNIIRVVETANGAEKFRMSHAHFAQKVIISHDGEWIASTGYDHVVRIWDSVSGTQMLEIPLDANGSAISFNKDGSRLVATDESGNITVWNISDLKTRTGYIKFPEFVREVHFTPDGNSLIVNSDDYNIWRLPSNQIDQTTDGTKGKIIVTAHSLTYQTAVSPDSKWVAAVEYDSEDAGNNRGILVSIDGKVKYPLEHGGEVTAVAFTNDSKFAATAGVDGYIKLWDVQSGRGQETELKNPEVIYSLAIAPKGSLAVAGLHGKINIWDLSSGHLAGNVAQSGDITTASFNEDGTMLATGSSEGTITIWAVDGSTLTPIGEPIRTNSEMRSLAFKPGGEWLAGGGSTGFAYVWNVSSTQELARLSLGNNPVTSVTFSMDGKQLLTVSRKVVRIWDVAGIHLVPKENLVEYACSHLLTNLSADEWNNYFYNETYRFTCPALPAKE